MTATAANERHRPTPSGDAFAAITPNWFAAVMGTGIVSVAAASLPVPVPGLHAFGVAVWALAVVVLAVLLAATAAHWVRHPTTARGHHRDPVMAHFYGAPPMALLTVGAATLLLGRDVIGSPAAVAVDWVLWSAGTLFGLGTTVAIPYLQFVRHRDVSRTVFAGWLMPVVPPLVSASTGALLVPHTAAGGLRLTLVFFCYAMFGISVLASVVIISLLVRRLATHGVGAPRFVPTVWIALGPFGQSITAAGLLGTAAGHALPAHAHLFRAFGIGFGIPVWLGAVLWGGFAALRTVRTVHEDGLPFALTWWSFTFPVGTCVTGSTQLYLETGAGVFRVAAVAVYVGLLTAWAVVFTSTVRGCVSRDLLRPAQPSPTAGALSRAE